MHEVNDLRRLTLFSELSETEAEMLKRFVSVKKYRKGEIIFLDTEPYSGFYGILEGMVKIYKISNEGREHILHLEYSGSTFGEVPMFENMSSDFEGGLTYPANATALEETTTVVLVPMKPFLEFLKSNNNVCLKMLSAFAKRMRFLNSHIESITLDDVSKRLSRYLLKELEKKGRKSSDSDIELEITKYDLASHLGTILETLSRAFRKLHNEGIIEVKGKTISVLDVKGLRRYQK